MLCDVPTKIKSLPFTPSSSLSFDGGGDVMSLYPPLSPPKLKLRSRHTRGPGKESGTSFRFTGPGS